MIGISKQSNFNPVFSADKTRATLKNMNRVLKIFVLWLMIATLPIQGWAAVVKASCGPAHHAAMSTTMDHASHGHHDMASAGEHHANAPESAPSASQVDAKSAYCSACAACCAGAVAPPAVATKIISPDYSETVHLAASVSVISFISPSLERPPRQSLV
jgi:hypothetical protein